MHSYSVAEGHAALDRSVGQTLGEGPIARVERGAVRLRAERPVRERAVLIDPPKDAERYGPRHGGRHCYEGASAAA